MKFVDEANISVRAGNGGKGCCSFRREKYIPFGGPDGGDGGDGGSVFLVAHPQINTLVEFRYTRNFQAKGGEAGKGANCTGKSADDLIIPVPVGTLIYDNNSAELLGDLTKAGQILKVAQGGFHGLGNTRYKSSINRAPRDTSPGSPGETRDLHLELKVLADVGLLGLPNAGKSSLIRAVSSAKPRVADYAFTTLYPNLGVVRVDALNSFVIADIPGVIEGASEGAGLGIHFLKHLMRTSLLLHIIDLAPLDDSDPVQAAKTIIQELQQFSPELAQKPRWLVLNKSDLLTPEAAQTQADAITTALNWQAPVHIISAQTKANTEALVFAINQYLLRTMKQ